MNIWKRINKLNKELDLAREKIKTFEEDNQDNVRICSECGHLMNEGFVIENGIEYYCSDKCLTKNISEEDYLKLYDNGNGDSYWTQWR